MTKTEVAHFMQKIQAYYPNFTMEKFKINEWYDKLKNYDINDVYKKLDQHLEGEFKDRPPMLHYITRYLKTPKEKKKEVENDFDVYCTLCGRTMKLKEFEDTHFKKCSSIKFIQRVMKKQGEEIEYDRLYNMGPEQFKKVYLECKEYNDEKNVRSKISIKKESTQPRDYLY